MDEIPPEFLKALVVVLWAVLAEMPQQHCVDIGNSAYGVSDCGSPFLKRRTGGGVPTTGWSHLLSHSGKVLFQGDGEESLADS